MSVNWNCWIGDENGANQVALSGIWQPKPRPWPKPVQLGSDHVMLSGVVDPQRFGWRKKIQVRLPRTTPEIAHAIEAIYYRKDSNGFQKKVTVNNGDKTFLCSWEKEFEMEPLDDRLPERWQMVCDFLIESEVE